MEILEDFDDFISLSKKVATDLTKSGSQWTLKMLSTTFFGVRDI